MPFVRHMSYHGKIRLNEKETKMAYMSFESEMFEIFKIDGTNLILEYGNYTSVPQYRQISGNFGTTAKIERGELIGVNHEMSVSSKYIIILYSKKEDWGSPHFSQQGKDLLIFDWKGKPVAHYELDCPVTSIAITEDSKRIYAISATEEPQIIYFDL